MKIPPHRNRQNKQNNDTIAINRNGWKKIELFISLLFKIDEKTQKNVLQTYKKKKNRKQQHREMETIATRKRREQ